MWLKMLYLLEIIFYLLSLTISGKDNAISHVRMRMQPPLNTASGLQLLYRSLGFVGMNRGDAGQSWDPSAFGSGAESSRFAEGL